MTLHKNQTAEDNDQRIIAAKTALVDMVRAQISLYSFLEQAWPYIHGSGCEFIGGWPIEALSEHLEALVRGDIRKLIINVPPRTGKTSLVSIALVPWYWLIDPGKKFLYCSYEHGLSMGHSTLCRQLIDSPFYQERWGDRYQLSKDQNTQYCFANNHYGERRAVSVNGANTGHGGDILICDDPNNAHDVNSEKSREATNAWFSQVWSTRLNNPKTGSMLVVQQRVHDRDVTGHILASSLGKEWVHLFLPNEYEIVRKCRTIILPSTYNKVWEDPRQEEGALLFPDRYGEKETNEKKHFLGAYGYGGQYQQRPSPQTGGIFHKKSFRIWGHKSIHDLPRFKEIFCSVDTAMETNENSSYSACTSWGLFSQDGVYQLMLLGLFKKKVPFKALCEKMRDLSKDCREDGEQMIDRSLSVMFRPEYFLIEKKTLGAPLGQYLLDMDIEVRFFNTGNKYQGYHGGKTERARSCGYFLGSEDNEHDQGIIWLLGEERDNFDKLYRFSHKFLKDALLFPNGASSDVVDTFSQAVLHLKNCGYLKHPVDIKAQKEREREARYNYPF